MFEPKQVIKGRSLFISAGVKHYNILETVFLPDFEYFTQSFLLTLFFPLLLPISLGTQPNHATPTLAGFKSGPASENEKTQSAKSYLLFRSSNRSSGSIFLIS